ncbi:ABC transporter substrate-binding protein [Pseudactinotalea sp. Z1739]|uniref:ABC transporter substrate-binding protein n=1 Tax=Pseudactinotalea sp. Z1739 TaxID=3413028 RepID=UPI003C79D4CB
MKRSKFVSATAAVGGAALLLAACGNGDSDAGGGVPDDPEEVSGSITVWTYPLATVDSLGWWEPHVDAFNEQYPDVEVEVVMQAFQNREEALVTAIAGNNAPDVVYFNPDFIPQYAEEDLLLPLDDLRDDWDTAFIDSSLQAMTWDDTLYGAPLLMQIMTTYCNTEVMDEAGVETCPTTWDEFRDVAPQFQDAGYYASEYSGTSTLNHTYYKFLWQAGGEVLNEDLTAAAFNSPEGLEALEFIKEMVDEGWVPDEPLSVSATFEQSQAGQGNVGYIMGANLGEHRTTIDSDNMDVVAPMTNVEQVASGSVGAWSIFNTTDSPEAAQAFVHFLSDQEFIEEFIADSGFLPPREDVDTDEIFADDPQTAEGAQYLDTVRSGVMHPQAREIIDTIRPHIQSVLLEGTEPQDALDAAEQEVNDLLERAG